MISRSSGRERGEGRAQQVGVLVARLLVAGCGLRVRRAATRAGGGARGRWRSGSRSCGPRRGSSTGGGSGRARGTPGGTPPARRPRRGAASPVMRRAAASATARPGARARRRRPGRRGAPARRGSSSSPGARGGSGARRPTGTQVSARRLAGTRRATCSVVVAAARASACGTSANFCCWSGVRIGQISARILAKSSAPSAWTSPTSLRAARIVGLVGRLREDRVVQRAARGHAGLDVRLDLVGVRLEDAADLASAGRRSGRGRWTMWSNIRAARSAVRACRAHLPAEQPARRRGRRRRGRRSPRRSGSERRTVLDAHRMTPCSSP